MPENSSLLTTSKKEITDMSSYRSSAVMMLWTPLPEVASAILY